MKDVKREGWLPYLKLSFVFPVLEENWSDS